MKKFCILPLIAALAFFVSCQKQQSEEEKKAEVERQVQERLAAERQADDRERLAKQQADLEAREKALAAKEAAGAEPNVPAEPDVIAEPNVPEETPMEEPVEAPQTVRQPRDPSETRSTASYGTFYRKLEPHGAWRETADYGYVWQPREAEDRSWRPYTDGRWVYTDVGWTWISEEPFGWATYHYGRWVRLRRVGWVWVPGEEWAPAWVSWRTSKDYVGWAPLPPEARFDRKRGIRNWADNHYDIGPDQYSFVPNNEFGSERIQRSVVPIERNITIVVETTNVTNITFSNTTIVNQGPNFEEMRTRSRRPIERYRLERQMNSERTERPTVRGEILVMSAPAITRVPGVDRPQTVKETIADATVEKSWAADADRAAADRARAKMKAESTPPADAPSKTFVKPGPPTTSATPPGATAAPTSPSSVTTPTTMASATPAPAVRATPAIPSPTPPSITRATPRPTLAAAVSPPARTTPVAVPTVTPSVLASPTPAPRASVTPKPAATIAGSPVPLASPRPRQPVPRSSPPESAKPNASPEMTPAVPSTPARVPQTTPRPIVPTPASTPAARPSSPQPDETIAKPSPRSDLAPRPMASPRVPRPPVATPPNEPKPVVRQTPPGVRIRPPADAAAIPSASPEDPNANDKRPKRPGRGEGDKPAPSPAGSPRPE